MTIWQMLSIYGKKDGKHIFAHIWSQQGVIAYFGIWVKIVVFISPYWAKN